eukprot:3741552-Amphidinium_carterae.1
MAKMEGHNVMWPYRRVLFVVGVVVIGFICCEFVNNVRSKSRAFVAGAFRWKQTMKFPDFFAETIQRSELDMSRCYHIENVSHSDGWHMRQTWRRHD